MAALPDLRTLEVVDGCKPQEIPAYVFESDVPLVLRGLVSEWPAVETELGPGGVVEVHPEP